jgi:hypothetical protein
MSSTSLPALLTAVVEWGNKLERSLEEIAAVVEPCIRQSIVMTLLPARAVDPNYHGSIDAAIQEHLDVIKIQLSSEQKTVLRDICLSIRKYQGLDHRAARNLTKSLAELRGLPTIYNALLIRQAGRCIWCGVPFDDPNVLETLDHVTPKHLGNDPSDGRNWALACLSCNQGKGDALAWAARPEAHDLVGRNDFLGTGSIKLRQRWSVLMRSRACDACKQGAGIKELWVYRRVRTGLAIPSNCSATCEACAIARGREILRPAWCPEEAQRRVPP